MLYIIMWQAFLKLTVLLTWDGILFWVTTTFLKCKKAIIFKQFFRMASIFPNSIFKVQSWNRAQGFYCFILLTTSLSLLQATSNYMIQTVKNKS